MKRHIGTFQTEQEAYLALLDLETLVGREQDITVFTKDPFAFQKLRVALEKNKEAYVSVGQLYHGEGFLHVVQSMGAQDMDEAHMASLTKDFMDGKILVFLGTREEVRHTLTERLPKYSLREDPLTPGSFTLYNPMEEDNPGTHEASERKGSFKRPDLKETEVKETVYEEKPLSEITDEQELLRRTKTKHEPLRRSVDDVDPFDPADPRYIP